MSNLELDINELLGLVDPTVQQEVSPTAQQEVSSTAQQEVFPPEGQEILNLLREPNSIDIPPQPPKLPLPQQNNNDQLHNENAQPLIPNEVNKHKRKIPALMDIEVKRPKQVLELEIDNKFLEKVKTIFGSTIPEVPCWFYNRGRCREGGAAHGKFVHVCAHCFEVASIMCAHPILNCPLRK